MNSAWDKFVLIGAAAVVLAVSGLFAFKAFSFPKQFERDAIVENDAIAENDLNRVKEANAIVNANAQWKLPMKGDPPKPLPLFKSITIVEVNGNLIDMMNPTSELVRPPVSNQWLIEHNLPFLNAAVLSQDSDNDGFSNIEEWEVKTGPKDPNAHPPYTGKLYVKERKSKGYKLKFAAKPDAERFQIIREPTAAWQRRETFIMRIGEISSDQQFRIDAYEEIEKEINGIKKDVSELKITYMPSAEKQVIQKSISKIIPTYFGELTYDLGTVEPQNIKEGDTFTLSNDQKNKYRLLKIEEDSAKISVESDTGQKKDIEISKKS